MRAQVCIVYGFASESMLISPFAVPGRSISGYFPEKFSAEIIGMEFSHAFVMPLTIADNEGVDPFSRVRPIDSSHKIRACIEHFRDGATWDETGIIDASMNHVERTGKPLDGCSQRSDFVRRYKRLDKLYDELKGGGTLRSNPFNDAIVHIGKNGEVYFGGGATHRTAIAWVLDISIPVRPFLIHKDGLFKLPELMLDTEAHQ